MRRHTRFIWCILAALAFCAVTYGGCGGSDNLASIADTTSKDTTPTSGDVSGRGDDWEELEFDRLSVLENTWRITDIDLEIDLMKDWYLLTNILNSTVTITVSDRPRKDVGKVNLSKNLLCEFYIVDEDGTQMEDFQQLMPNGETFYALSDNGFATLTGALGDSFIAEVKDNGKTLVVTSEAPNRLGANETYTIITTMKALY